LFAEIGSGGTVRDVGLPNAKIIAHAGYRVGTLVGNNYTGTISGCFAGGSVTSKEAYSEYVGGLVGLDTEGAITNSHSSSSVRVDVPIDGVGYNYVGGL